MSDTHIHYTRIRRGMIFWKDGETIESRNNSFSEDKYYPWVVVSSDQRNVKNIISIVPIIRMAKPPKGSTNYVEMIFHNSPSYIMCDTIQTVQASFLESSKYDGWLTPETMDKVTDKLRKSLSVEYSAKDLMSTSTTAKLESVIDQIIQKKLDDIRTSVPQSEIDDVAIKVSETIENLFDVKGEPAPEPVNTEVEEFEEEVIEDFKPEELPVPNKRTGRQNRWTQEAIIEFLHKYDCCSDYEILAKEYHFKNVRSMIQTRRDLVKKLEKMSES